MNEKTLPLKMSSSEWVNHVKEFLTPADLEEDTLFAFLHYLADLKILVHCEKDTWRWNGILDPLKWEEQKLFMQNEIERASHTESGFALPYFIGYKNIELPLLESLMGSAEKNKSSSSIKIKNIPKPEPASDFSNLQIVKKVGRQLKPFLDAELIIVSRLTGKHTSKTEARKLFHYMFGKMGSKAEPRKWEQLSRKRHR